MTNPTDAINAYIAGNRIGSLNLSDCTGLTSLPNGLSVGGSLHLGGTKIAPFLRHRGYQAYCHEGRVYAGCRNFSIAEARQHWAADPVVIAAIDAIGGAA